jgi:acetyl esterase/lipase
MIRHRSWTGALALLGACVCVAPTAAQQPAKPPEPPPGVKALRDLAYVKDGHERQKLDLYLPEKADAPLPVIIWIHGGGWRAGSKENNPALPFTTRGYAVASINYRLSQHAVFPAQIEDCKAAIRWLRAHAKEYHLNPERFGVWGASAGGHLVALLGTSGHVKELEGKDGNLDQSSRVQAVVDFFGPTDFLQMGGRHNDAQSPESVLIGGALQENKEKAAKANPITYVTKEAAPFLILHGDKDSAVPYNQSELLTEALKKAGAEVTLQKIEGAGHGGPAFNSEENRKLIETFFDKHLKRTTAAAQPPARPPEPPPGVKALRDLAYVSDGHERQKLDLYLPEKADGPLPIIVWIHGGAWRAGSKERTPALLFTTRGYAVASINYRLSQHAVFPAQIEDCKTAIRWLRAHAKQYNLDPEHVGVWGGSAGGHLVALLGTTNHIKDLDGKGNLDQSSRVQAVVDWYGPSDFLHFRGAGSDPKGPVSQLLGGTLQDNKEKAVLASPVTHVTKEAAPFLIMHGDKDEAVPFSQSEILTEALKKAGVEVTLKKLEGAGHGGPAFTNEESRKLIADFFDKHLEAKKK